MGSRKSENKIEYSKETFLTKDQAKSMTYEDLLEFILNCLDNNYGIIADACRQSNIDRNTFYNYLKKFPDFKKSVEDIQENQIDFVERKLYDIINIGHPNSIQFYLRTKGKSRGYQESMVNHNVNQDMKIGFIDEDVDIDTDENELLD